MKANRVDPYDAGHMLDTQEDSSKGTNRDSIDLESQPQNPKTPKPHELSS